MYKVDVIWDLLKIGQPSDFFYKSSKETNRNVKEAKEIFLVKTRKQRINGRKIERAALRYEVCEASMLRSLKKYFSRVSRGSFARFEIAGEKSAAGGAFQSVATAGGRGGRRGRTFCLSCHVLRFESSKLHRSGNHHRIVARARRLGDGQLSPARKRMRDSSPGRTDGTISANCV